MIFIMTDNYIHYSSDVPAWFLEFVCYLSCLILWVPLDFGVPVISRFHWFLVYICSMFIDSVDSFSSLTMHCLRMCKWIYTKLRVMTSLITPNLFWRHSRAVLVCSQESLFNHQKLKTSKWSKPEIIFFLQMASLLIPVHSLKRC